MAPTTDMMKPAACPSWYQPMARPARWSWGACDGLFTPRPLGPLYDLADQLGGALLDLCSRGADSGAGRGADLEAQVSITFDQSVSGAQIPLQVPTHTTCNTCRGTGAKPGTTPAVCPRCEGRGIETQGQGMFSISQPCSIKPSAGCVNAT